MRRIMCIIIPFFVALITLNSLNDYLDKNIAIMLEKKGLTWESKEYEGYCKDTGVVFNNYLADKDYILLQATSELKAPVRQAPIGFFPIDGMNDIETVGAQGWQSITHTQVIGSIHTNNLDRKVVLIVSPQWFFNKKGVPPENFQASFSPVQFYSFLENANIKDEHKIQYASRMSKLLTGSAQYFPEKLYAKLYTNNNILANTVRLAFKPYFYCRKNIVKLKDKGLLYKKLNLLYDKNEEALRKIDWDEEFKIAHDEGKNKVTNNEYMVYDEFYNNYKESLEKQKGYLGACDVLDSKEYNDFELYLDVCDDLGIKPYIIICPTNGKWYDELGMTKERRWELYKKIRGIAENKGLDVLSFEDKEYTPYFMCDAAHFGWEGWLEVDKELYERFGNK